MNCKQTVKMVIFHTVKQHNDDWTFYYQPPTDIMNLWKVEKMKIT